MKIISVLICFAVFPFISNAQEKEITKSVSFFSTVSAGYLFGESGVFPGAQINSGISLPHFNLSVGGGYDGYRFKSFPIFAGISRHFNRSKNLFGFINGGYHFPKDEETYDIWSSPGTEKWEGGLYADAGFGFRLKLGKNNNLLLSSSYNYKKVRHLKSYVSPCLIFPCPENIIISDYGLNYLSMRLGWEINY